MPYGNPFYVQPAGDMSAGLSGLGATLRDIGEQRRQREEQEAQQKQLEDARAEIATAIKSGDTDQINQAAIKYPGFADSIYKGMNISRQDQKDRMVGHLREIVTSDPEQIPSILESRIEEIEARGGDATETKRELQMYRQNPEAMQKNFRMAYAAVASPNEYKQWSEADKSPTPVIYADTQGKVIGQAIPGTDEAKALEQKGGIAVKQPSLSELRPESPQKADVVNIQQPDGTIKGFMATDAAGIQDALKAGGVQVGNAPVQQGSELDDTAIEDAAARYRMTGQMPPLGRGNSAMVARAKILNRSAEQARASGQDGQAVVLEQQAMKANSAALTQLSKQQNMVGAFEKTARKNGDLALELSDKVDRTINAPIFEKWVQAGRVGLKGDTDVTNLNNAVETFVNEYAKVISGSMGNTAVSDTARAHAHSLLYGAMKKDQFKGALGVLNKEMNNRMQGFEDQKDELMSSMRGDKGKEKSDESADKGGWTTLPNGVKIRVKQ